MLPRGLFRKLAPHGLALGRRLTRRQLLDLVTLLRARPHPSRGPELWRQSRPRGRVTPSRRLLCLFLALISETQEPQRQVPAVKQARTVSVSAPQEGLTLCRPRVTPLGR